MLEIGSVVDGKYKILSEVGHGGMSVVYLAINERANKTWAIKEVRRDGAVDSNVVINGLVAETNMLKRLNHPHLPSIVDVIETQESFMIVMDYIEGKSLESLLRHEGAQDPNLVIEWAKQLCDVLGYLHSRERPIIYRDMKPANVMLKPDGNVVLIDFGTAREFKNANVEDTTCLGTRGYAAPEQFGGHGQTDARTDIYCLGATIYHLITGQSPCEPPYEIKPLGYWIPQLSGSGIEKIVAKCTQQDPRQRYQNCGELMYALEHVHDEDDVARKRRGRIWTGFIACIVVAVLGVVGMVGFTLAGNSATSDTYDSYITAATSANNLTEATAYFKQAIELDPSSATGYEKMLDYVEHDSVFTAEESTAVISCFNNTHGGTKTNLNYLSKADYADVVYRLANDYYFFYEGSDARARAAEWYGKILDSTTLSENEMTMVNALYSIGTYYDSLFTQNSGFGVDEDDDATFITLWNDLAELTDDDLTAKTGRVSYAAALYQEFVTQIYTNASYFKSSGVTEGEMTEQLDKLESGLTGLDTSASTTAAAIVSEATELIAQARQQVASVYTVVGGSATASDGAGS